MTFSADLAQAFPDCFRVLILDNEVTVDAFVTEPPLPWARLVAVDGIYRLAPNYPTPLTPEHADREELNWDVVSPGAICTALAQLDDGIDMVAFGNNAAQGLPLALALPAARRRAMGVVIYGRSLPEQAQYEAAGYTRFCSRTDLPAVIAEAARAAGRAPALAFINTIEHNEQNYHTPWNG